MLLQERKKEINVNSGELHFEPWAQWIRCQFTMGEVLNVEWRDGISK